MAVVGIDQFAEVLQESDWYTLGVFLGVKTAQLEFINNNYRLQGNIRCLIEIYKCLESNGKIPTLTWKSITSSLKRMNSIHIANKIDREYIGTPTQSSSQSSGSDNSLQPSISQSEPLTYPPTPESNTLQPIQSSSSIPSTDFSRTIRVPPEISMEFRQLSNSFTGLHVKAKHAFIHSNTELSDLQYVIEHRCGLEPLDGDNATLEKVLGQLQRNCTIFDSDCLMNLVKTLVSNNQKIQKEISDFQKEIDEFKSSAKMSHLVHLITADESTHEEEKVKAHCTNDRRKKIKLKVREFWKELNKKQFERAIMELLTTLYDFMYQISVGNGCIFITWAISCTKTIHFISKHSLEFAKIIGVISLHIGDEVIYNIEGRGCETIEAAMLQAIELKNTQAVEVLLAMGCNPEIALAYNGDMGLVNIVNILEGRVGSLPDGSSSSKHVCIFGHNRFVEAISDHRPDGEEVECELCKVKEKMLKQSYREIHFIKQKNEKLNANKEQDVCTADEMKTYSVSPKEEDDSNDGELEPTIETQEGSHEDLIERNMELKKELNDQKQLSTMLNKKIKKLELLLFKTEQEKKSLEGELSEVEENFDKLKKECVILQSNYKDNLKVNEKLNSKIVELELALAGEFQLDEEKFEIKKQEIADLRDIIAMKDQKLREFIEDNDAKTKEIASIHEELNHAKENIEKEVQQKIIQSICVSPEEIKIHVAKKIGAGSYYEVNIAEYRRTRVAARRLYSFILSDKMVDRSVREATLSAQLHHPNIVQFIGAADLDSGNPPILLYELMTTSLYDYIQRGQQLTYPQIIDAGCDIAAALTYLHQHKPHPIIHRDIRSRNVLMDPLPKIGRWRHKLSGFGAATNLEHHDATAYPGSISYSAPEVGDPTSHTPSMDVYSYGILLMEVTLTVFPESNYAKRQFQADSIKWEPMKRLVKQCVQEDYKDRPSITTVLDSLEAIVEM